MKKITKKIYKEMVGVEPTYGDDLERCNCKKAGEFGHWNCGICDECNKPRFICGHFNKNEWIKIDYSVIPKELFEKYNIKPFEIMKRKMRNENGKVWNDINYFDAQKECEKLGYRLPNIREMLMLLECYKNVNEDISCNDKEFLGIEELSYDEDVCYEWIFNLKDVACRRGGGWGHTSIAGVFTLYLDIAPARATPPLGFRCAR